MSFIRRPLAASCAALIATATLVIASAMFDIVRLQQSLAGLA